MTIRFWAAAFPLSSLILTLAAAGCSSTTTTPGGTSGSCQADSSLVCGAGSDGFSCPSGSLPPASDGSCSDPVTDGTTDSYCCLTTAIAGCTVDTTITCPTAGSFGFDCTAGSADPSTTDATLVCSTPSTLASGDDGYCCTDGTGGGGSCQADSSVTCTTTGSSGFSCPTGSAPPAADGTCSEPVTVGGNDTYCCFTGQTFTGCTVDPTITCPTAGSFGFDCTTNSADPSTDDPTLTCSTPATLANGDDGYCCTSGGTTASCAADSTVTCTTSGSSGFSCPAGSAAPAGDGICSEPVTVGSNDTYCCFTDTFVGCTVDYTITCPTAGSYGFDCTPGSDSPDTQDTTLTCSAAVTLGNGDDGYCCE